VSSAGFEVRETAPSERLDELLDLLVARDLRGHTVAFQHYGEHNTAASDALRGAGAHVIDVPVYKWRLPDDAGDALRLVDALCAGEVDAVTFTSAPAVANLMHLARGAGHADEVLSAFNEKRVVAACIGPVCAAAAERCGIDAPLAPAHGRLGLLVRALDQALTDRRRTLTAAGADLVIQGRAVAVDGAVIELTPRERAVLDALVRRSGAVASKATLLREVWSDQADPHAVEATVGRLRRRLGAGGDALRSVRGRGYLIDISETSR
jgi:uroporphyrinogen-III synthase